MDREQLLARLEDLRRQQQQAQATFHAVGGAIQECEFWLNQIPAVAVAAEELGRE